MRKPLVLLLLTPALLLPLALPAKAKARVRPKERAEVNQSSDDRQLPAFLEPPTVKQTVLLDLSESGYSGLGVLYDRALGLRNSVNAGIAVAGSGVPSNYWTSVELKAGYSWWIHKDFWPHPDRPLLGWFVGPELKVNLVRWHLDWGGGSYDSSGAYVGGAAVGGYQWIFQPGLTARAYAEAGYLGGGLNGQYGYNVGYGGAFVGGHLAVGWSF